MQAHSVDVRDVTKVYRTGDVTVTAVDDVSFTLNKGEFAAIVGPSGSGKSTLMNMLGTIDKPTSGEVYIDGVPTTKMDEAELAKFRNERMGFVFQAFNLIGGLTAEQNVALPLLVGSVPEMERNKRADALLEKLGLGHRLKMRPNQLSGGEQQRVAIARALVNNPRLILADEPTGDIDSKAGEELVRLLKQIADGGVTVVMVTHNPDATKYCDKVIHIKDSKIEKEVVFSRRRQR